MRILDHANRHDGAALVTNRGGRRRSGFVPSATSTGRFAATLSLGSLGWREARVRAAMAMGAPIPTRIADSRAASPKREGGGEAASGLGRRHGTERLTRPPHPAAPRRPSPARGARREGAGVGADIICYNDMMCVYVYFSLAERKVAP
jgi:hypothetical protein